MVSDMTDRLPTLDDDGLYTPDVGDWAEQKYRLVSSYATMFSTAMKGKWHRVYIDLFAGAGRARIKNSQRIVPASPLLALNVPNKFDLHIFCEKEKKTIDTLEKRVSESYPNVASRFLRGDANNLTEQILKEIPQANPNFKVLSFCFADPFALENLAFDTIRELSSRFIDFLVLIPTGMDAVRNVSRYISSTNTTVDRFLGLATWREKWHEAEKEGENFGTFITNCFGEQMTKLGYNYSGIDKTQQIRSTEKNLPLYRLAFFSRSDLGEKFWREALKYSSDQMGFGF